MKLKLNIYAVSEKTLDIVLHVCSVVHVVDLFSR